MAAEFDVTLSAMTNAAKNIKNYTVEFKEQANQVYQAAQVLSEAWVGDASATFVENMGELHKWMTEMAATLDTYSAALDTACETYETADINSAKNF